MQQINLKNLIAPSFYSVHRVLKERKYNYVWLKGGRGSTKSSFVSLEVVMGIMSDPLANATVLRKVKDTLGDTVFEQYLWALDVLGVTHLWRATQSPYRLQYLPTQQRIVFKGADNPRKVKSSKFKRGYNKYIHYEELDEFGLWDDVDTINKSLVRGGDEAVVFYTYNPPRSAASWINAEVALQALRNDTFVHHSTYLDVPPEWLGKPFIADAEHAKLTNNDRYRYVYLGESVGTGAEVFTNITKRRISDEEIERFDKIYRGLDFGYTNPSHYTENSLNKDKRQLFIFAEVHKSGMSNRSLVDAIKVLNPRNGYITADSEDGRTIAELNDLGLRVDGAKKGGGSRDHGIKWLQDLNEIIIDPERCPNTAREFTEYEVERDAKGNLRDSFPKKNDHSIDAIRYSLEPELATSKWLI
jgi:PBSX family phage terminase large subunit